MCNTVAGRSMANLEDVKFIKQLSIVPTFSCRVLSRYEASSLLNYMSNTCILSIHQHTVKRSQSFHDRTITTFSKTFSTISSTDRKYFWRCDPRASHVPPLIGQWRCEKLLYSRKLVGPSAIAEEDYKSMRKVRSRRMQTFG